MINLKGFTLRPYQQSIVETAIKKNILVVLPTGLGKTAISMVLGIHRLNQHKNSKVILTAPTKPLCQQHYDTFLEKTDIIHEEVALLTGATPPKKREQIFNTASIIIATPQTLQSDIIAKRLDLKNVVLLTIDEAHRAVSDYAYTWVAKKYVEEASYPKILALTASPGTDKQKVQEVCNNLFIEDIEARSESDPDVEPFVQQLNIHWENIKFTDELREISDLLAQASKKRFEELKSWGFAGRAQMIIGKTQLLEAQKAIQRRIARGEKDARIWMGLSIVSQCIKLSYAQELIETQGIRPFLAYVDEVMRQAGVSKSKAIKRIAEDPMVKQAWMKAKGLKENNVRHPKLQKLKSIIKERIKNNPDAKLIIFSSYRETVSEIVDFLNEEKGISARIFVGQSKKKGVGLSQKEQANILQDFSENKFNVLVGTSITEEGIDIPKVDLVIFYEPIPSAIRTVQRRGRTARTSKGEVIILITEKTKDEAYHWVAVRKEKSMKSLLDSVKKSLLLEPKKNIPEPVKSKEEVVIIADSREKPNMVVKELSENGVRVESKILDVGDYVLAEGVVCERKTAKDLVDSLIDGRLMVQLKDLRDQAKKPFLILEGTEDLYSVRSVHPNAIRGMLASIIFSYGIPIVYTKDPKDTAHFLRIAARRMQLEGHKEFIDLKKSAKTAQDLQLSLVGSLPDVGPKLAGRLLKEFKTVRKVFSSKELDKVEGLGKKKAERIKDLLDKEFEKGG